MRGPQPAACLRNTIRCEDWMERAVSLKTAHEQASGNRVGSCCTYKRDPGAPLRQWQCLSNICRQCTAQHSLSGMKTLKCVSKLLENPPVLIEGNGDRRLMVRGCSIRDFKLTNPTPRAVEDENEHICIAMLMLHNLQVQYMANSVSE